MSHATYYPDGGAALSPTPEPKRAVATDEVPATADLNQTVSSPPTQGEVQAISDKVDELLAALRANGPLAS